MDKNINLVVSADLSQLESGIASVSTSVNTLQTETQKLGQTTKQVFGTAGENADKYAQNFNDIQTKIAELNEKLRNEIALKKQSQTVTAQRIQQLVKERDAIEKQALALTKTQTQAQKANNVFRQLGITISAAFAVRAVVRFISASVRAYDEAIASETKLLTALKGRQDVQKILIEQATQLQGTTRFADEQVIDVQTRLAKALGANSDAIQQLTPLILDFATVQGTDAATSADLVAKAFLGSSAALGRYGIKIDATATEAEKLAQITERLTTLFGGQAEAVAKVGTGGLTQLRNTFNDIQELIGKDFSQGSFGAISALKNLLGEVRNSLQLADTFDIRLAQTKFNTLIDSYNNSNLSQERRVELLKEAQKIEPSFLAGIDLEKATFRQIFTAVAAANEKFRERERLLIAQKVAQENLNRAAEIQADIDDLRAQATANLTDAQRKGIASTDDASISVTNFSLELFKSVGILGGFSDQIGQAQLNFAALKESALESAIALKANQEALNAIFADAENNGAQINNLINLFKQLGGTDKQLEALLANFDKLTGKGEGGDDDDTKLPKDLRTEYEKLSAAIDELNKALLEQIILKDTNFEKTAKEIKLLQEQKDKIDQIAETTKKQIADAGAIRLEIVPFIKSESLLTIQQNLAESIPEELQKSESAFGKAALESGEKAGESWLDGFLMSIIEFKDDKQLQDLKSALDQALNFIVKTSIDLLTQFDDSAITGLELLIQGLDDRIAATDDALNREFELKKQGFANNYELERENLAALNALRDKAQADRDAQIEKQRQAEQTATVIQTVAASITTVAKAYQDYDPLVATIIATLALGSLIGLIASAKSQGESAAQFAGGYADILSGNSHAGGGVSLGELGEAEGGEFIGIGSKKATNKYGKGLKSLFDGINTANSDKIAAGIGSITLKSGIMEGGDVNHNISLNEIPEIKDIRNILKRQTGTVIYENGRRIEKSGGKTRIINVN